MSSDQDDIFAKTQERLRAEVKATLEGPFYSNPQTLYNLFNLKSLESNETKDKICKLWNHNQERPEYRDFKDQWMKASNKEKQLVEYQYKHWYRDILTLEKIASLNNIQLERTKYQTCEYSNVFIRL